jgi:endonuclease/exonuclease/phosphatase family metal-dependent hydrolase
MKIKLLQLNMNANNYWDTFIPFITSQNFDIINLQELTGKHTISGNMNSEIDVFEELQKILLSQYNGELSINTRYSSDPSNSYMGNATFYKKRFILEKKNILTLHKKTKPFPSEKTHYEELGRTAIHLKLSIDDKRISIINAHLAWAKTPEEEPHQTKQGEIFLKYLENISAPFILSGDFNLSPDQPLVKKIDKLARNLTSEYHVTNTLNPRTHRAQILFPAGVAVDYIYISNDLEVKSLSIIDEDISDHLGLTAEIEI